MSLDNILENFTVGMRKLGRMDTCIIFSVNCNLIDISDIENIHQYLIKDNNIKCLVLLSKCLLCY